MIEKEKRMYYGLFDLTKKGNYKLYRVFKERFACEEFMFMMDLKLHIFGIDIEDIPSHIKVNETRLRYTQLPKSKGGEMQFVKYKFGDQSSYIPTWKVKY